jgi:predicted DNA binding CopG/RHH family protein
MPNAPKTPTRTIRVSSDLWGAVKEKAAIEGRTVTDVIVEALKKYIGPERAPGYPDQELWDKNK